MRKAKIQVKQHNSPASGFVTAALAYGERNESPSSDIIFCGSLAILPALSPPKLSNTTAPRADS